MGQRQPSIGSKSSVCWVFEVLIKILRKQSVAKSVDVIMGELLLELVF